MIAGAILCELTTAIVSGLNRPIARSAALALGLAIALGSAQAQAKMPPANGLSCEPAIADAARRTRVPGSLMKAIGLVESGRPDPVSGAWRSWPWAINAEGTGFFFNSKPEAIAAVQALQATGVHSIDVGCMQVNLVQHPDAFATLDDAFDPARNATYAGGFLARLFQKSGDWMIAAGWYHSTTADLAADYMKRVAAILPGGRQGALTGKEDFRSLVVKTAAPVLGRDGMILPSIRLNASGQVPAHSVQPYLAAHAKSRLRPGR